MSTVMASGQVMRRDTKQHQMSAQISSHGSVETANHSYAQSATLAAKVILPQQCNDWGMTDAESCIDKCYAVEVARESAQSEEEGWWGAVGGIFGANVISLEDTSKSGGLVAKNQKFIGIAIAAVSALGSVVTGVGSALIADEHTRENLNAQNCEQLSAVLMTRKLASMENKLGRIDDAISMIASTNRKVMEVHAAVKQMEQKLTNKLHETYLLINTVRLETRMTDFLKCAGWVQHGHAAAQGIFADWQSMKQSFRQVAARSSEADSSSLAQEWLTSFKSWQNNLPGRLDPVAIQALDGLRCMSDIISQTDFFELYLKNQLKTKLRAEISIHGWSESYQMMRYFQNISIQTITDMFQQDEILPLIHASISQLRFILGLAPREGYWEYFALYMSNLNVAFSAFLKKDAMLTLASKAFQAGLEEIAPSFYPVSQNCMNKISQQFPGVNTATASVWHIDPDRVHVVENLGIMLQPEDHAVDPTKGSYYSCTHSGMVSKLASEPLGINYNIGLTGMVFDDDFKAQHIDAERPWVCGIRFINQKGSAVAAYHSCISTEGQTPFSCRDKLKLTCPSDDTNVYRCPLPGCTQPTMGNKIIFTCTNFNGALMFFNDHGVAANCDNMCLKLKACGGCHREPSGKNGKCRLFPPNHDCAFQYGSQNWNGAYFKTLQRR